MSDPFPASFPALFRLAAVFLRGVEFSVFSFQSPALLKGTSSLIGYRAVRQCLMEFL